MREFFVEQEDDDGARLVAGPFESREDAEREALRIAMTPREAPREGAWEWVMDAEQGPRALLHVVEPRRPKTGKELLQALQHAGFVGMWADYDGIDDCAAFAQRLRDRAERR